MPPYRRRTDGPQAVTGSVALVDGEQADDGPGGLGLADPGSRRRLPQALGCRGDVDALGGGDDAERLVHAAVAVALLGCLGRREPGAEGQVGVRDGARRPGVALLGQLLEALG